MIVSDVLNFYKSETTYIPNSMIIKSFDDYGAIFKWLSQGNFSVMRREVFIATSGLETLENRTVITYVEIEAK